MPSGLSKPDKIAWLGIVLLPLATFLWLLPFPLNHDNAWLLEATRRWMAGERLYSDIMEINPPLIFLENLLLTAGTLTKTAYLAGTCVAIAVSGLWTVRMRGALPALAVVAALILAGISDFGERDHLALVFLAPFVMAPDRLGRGDRLALGAWGFLGAGLKPHFLLIPILFALARAAQERSARPLFELQNLAMAMLHAAFAILVWVAWPAYFSEIVPLGRQTYDYFGGAPLPIDLVAAAVIGIVGVAAMLRRQAIGAAVLGALLIYFLQGKYWHYQLIPALGLGAIAALTGKGLLRLVGLGLLCISPWIGPKRYASPAIPEGVHRVLFLADRVSAAYPLVLECGVRNASRYPTFWTLPGAWRSGNRPLFDRGIADLNADLRRERPELIYLDGAPGRFNAPFRFADWADLGEYREVGREGRYELWLRRDLDPAILSGKACALAG